MCKQNAEICKKVQHQVKIQFGMELFHKLSTGTAKNIPPKFKKDKSLKVEGNNAKPTKLLTDPIWFHNADTTQAKIVTRIIMLKAKKKW